MPIPTGIPVVDTMIGFAAPSGVERELPQVRPPLRSAGHTAAYLFEPTPGRGDQDPDPGQDPAQDPDPVVATLAAMDIHGIAIGLVNTDNPVAVDAARRHPDRFVLETHVGSMGAPFDVMAAVRRIRDEHAALGTRAVSFFPVGPEPAVPVDGPGAYPLYSTCVELGLPIFVNAGVPGPRVPTTAQRVERFDRVCYDFPELTIVMRHGAEPWVDLAVKLMVKWPGLHYSTSAFAPKHYPTAVLDFLDTRGADKVIYGGYYPMALDLDRIFAELDTLPLRPQRWEPFLSGNARRVLGLA